MCLYLKVEVWWPNDVTIATVINNDTYLPFVLPVAKYQPDVFLVTKEKHLVAINILTNWCTYLLNQSEH